MQALTFDKFNYSEYYGCRHWWDYGILNADDNYDLYVDDLKAVAAYQGY